MLLKQSDMMSKCNENVNNEISNRMSNRNSKLWARIVGEEFLPFKCNLILNAEICQIKSNENINMRLKGE